jgi:hypothetical protein
MTCEVDHLRMTDGSAWRIQRNIWRNDKAEERQRQKDRLAHPEQFSVKRTEAPSDFTSVMQKLTTLELLAHHYHVSVTTAFRWRRLVNDRLRDSRRASVSFS